MQILVFCEESAYTCCIGHLPCQQTVADAERVAVYWNAKCTNTGAAAGLPGKGGKADVDGMTFFRFQDAKIVEEWSLIDIATMQRQLAPN